MYTADDERGIWPRGPRHSAAEGTVLPNRFQFPITSDSTPDLNDLHKRISHRAPPITPETESIRPFTPQSEIVCLVIGLQISIFHIHEPVRIPIPNPRVRNTLRNRHTHPLTQQRKNENRRPEPASNDNATETPHHDQFNQHGQRRLPPLRSHPQARLSRATVAHHSSVPTSGFLIPSSHRAR